MAYISFKPEDYFNTLLYTGTGSSNAKTGVGFAPNFVWIKSRSNAQKHCLFDTPRGVQKVVYSDNSAAEVTEAQLITAFGSDGYTLGTDSDINGSSWTYAGWSWKAGTSTGVDFSSGDITPTAYSINTTSGIGIYHYNCTGANATMVHGLSSAPKMILTKSLGDSSAWAVWHSALTANTKYLVLDTNAAEATNANAWNSTAPSSSVISFGTDGQTNGTGKNNILYAFSEVKGYSAFGKYVASGNVDGPFIYTGFRPAFLMIKCVSATENWYMFDSKRAGYNFANYSFKANDTDIEATSTYLELESNGFKIRNAAGDLNASGQTFLYMAFAEYPLVGSNETPGLAR